jgi:polyhydroxyalkanoate synthase
MHGVPGRSTMFLSHEADAGAPPPGGLPTPEATTPGAVPRCPESPQAAAIDWGLHLSMSPAKQWALARRAVAASADFAVYAGRCFAAMPGTVEPPIADRRFAQEDWRRWPFNLLHQAFLSTERWWDEATHGVPGVGPHDQDLVAFGARQWLEMLSPSNLPAGNPVVLRRTVEQGGANLLRGALNLLDDTQRRAHGARPAGTDRFVVGRDVAATPGKVVLKNRLIELIQYRPATASVHPEPILIVPAWIMKYYILDLSPQDSLIKSLVDQGHTVFCVSWKNPGPEERELGMDNYLQLGFHAALDAVNAIVPGRGVHAAGYCLGGTLLSIAAAAMARDGDDRLRSMTLFAAETDFSEPGELGLFIDEAQIGQLEAQMDRTGYLEAAQMAGAFGMLRSHDLLWSRLVNDYLLGERAPMTDLMAWNADATRLPATMHSQYLRRLFLHNELAAGRYAVGGKAVSLGDLRLPVFMVGTVTDHVAPWRSVYKLHDLASTEISFVLTSGGHNAGIVSPPGHPHRHYRALTRMAGQPALPPDAWLAAAPEVDGSWWPAWQQWLQAHSGPPARPPALGAATLPPLGDAPGTYVLETST